jgi:hypothetical protein
MQRETNQRTICVEEHVVTVTKDDLAEALQGELAGDGIMVKADELRVCVGIGESQIVGPSQLRDLLRAQIEGLPDNAEIVLAVRWREEVEAPAHPPAPAGQPHYPAPQAYYPPPGYYPPQPQYQPPPPQYQQPPQQPQYQQPPQGGPICTTCGGQPDLQGPTPECADPMGCGRVRAQRGDLPVGRAVPPPGVGSVGAGILRGGASTLVNRETGETAFAAHDGRPYGVGHDYDNR